MTPKTKTRTTSEVSRRKFLGVAALAPVGLAATRVSAQRPRRARRSRAWALPDWQNQGLLVVRSAARPPTRSIPCEVTPCTGMFVKPLPDYRIYVEIEDGRNGIFDLKPYLDHGVFRELRDVHYFNQVGILFGAVNWPHEHEKLPLYWSDPERRFPFLIHCGTRVAGFVLVTRGSPASDDPDDFDIAEFFVVGRHRRSGVGRRAAFLLWNRFGGRWIVCVSEGNHIGCNFWRSVITEDTSGALSETIRPGSPHAWRVFSFDGIKRSGAV